MKPAIHNFRETAGDTFIRTLRIKVNGSALDMDGWTPTMHIRNLDGTLAVDWSSNVDTAAASAGELSISAASPGEGAYFYDLQMTTDGGDIKTYLAGVIDYGTERSQ